MSVSSSKLIVAEWMWASTVYDAGIGGADKIMARSARAGVTDIYFMVKGTGGKLFYLNTAYPSIRVAEDRDALQEAIDAAHAHGIRLHTWICIGRDVMYKDAHPDARLWPYQRENPTHRIDPRNEGYREYMKSVISELAAYDIDGIHLDYIRYNYIGGGWGDSDFATLAERGADLARVRELIETTLGYNREEADPEYIFEAYKNGDREAHLIAEYRRESITNLATALVTAAREAKPSLTVTAALMPEGAYNAGYADLHYGQNHEDATKLYDYICPMAYSTDFKLDAEWPIRSAKGDLALGAEVVVGLQAYNGAPAERIREEVDRLLALRAEDERVLGYSFFRNASYDYSTICENEDGRYSATLESATDQPWQSIKLVAQGETRILSVKAADGVAEGAEIAVSPDGKLAEAKGDDISPDGLCSFEVIIDGDAEGKVPFLLSPEGANPICVYNIFRPFERADK